MEGSAQKRDGGEGDAPPQTFVFADLAGYTALTEAHGDERAADVAASFTGEVRALLDDYDADEVKSIGDALMLHTADARVALHLAARIAGEFGSRHHSLGVRVGMHTGTAVERDGDWFGGAVNLASRVAAAAGPGEVLLTGATAEAAGAEHGQLELTPRGRQRFHNVSEPVEVFALAAHGGEGPLPIDPVCRMAVDPHRATQRVVHRGVEYHFCSAQCASAFSAAPERYSRALSRRADLLVSDRAREDAAERLGRAYRKGRLSADDLEDRAGRVWAARTRGELRAVTHDLPSRQRRRPFPYLFFRWMMRRLRGRR